MARIQENALKKNPRLRILDIRIANSQPKILNQKMSPSNRIPSIQVQKFSEDPLPASLKTGIRKISLIIVSGSEGNLTTLCEMEFFNFLWLIWVHYLPLRPT